MKDRVVQLKGNEIDFLKRVDFDPSSESHGAEYWLDVGVAAQKLTESLLERDAIPEVRIKFFTDPEFNIGGRGRSRAGVFEKNGTRGRAIFRHPHFLKYLHYFLYGPELPGDILNSFEERIEECGQISSSDIGPLGDFARQQVRAGRLDAAVAAEEFFKLALECDLDLMAARSIRDAVKRTR